MPCSSLTSTATTSMSKRCEPSRPRTRKLHLWAPASVATQFAETRRSCPHGSCEDESFKAAGFAIQTLRWPARGDPSDGCDSPERCVSHRRTGLPPRRFIDRADDAGNTVLVPIHAPWSKIGRGGGLRRQRPGEQRLPDPRRPAERRRAASSPRPMSAGSAGSTARSTGTWPCGRPSRFDYPAWVTSFDRARSVLAAHPIVDGHNDLAFALREQVDYDLDRFDVTARQTRDPNRSRSARRRWRRGSVLVGVRPVIRKPATAP